MCKTHGCYIYSRCRKADRPVYSSERTRADSGYRIGRCASLTVDTAVKSSSSYSVEVKERHPRVPLKFIPHDAIIIPGLVDSHAHLITYGWAKTLDLSDSHSVEEVVQRVREHIMARPDVKADTKAWIEGVGWDQNLWEDHEFPTAVCFYS